LTYRVRRNNNTDTPLPPEEPAGQNPPDGAMLDYFLKSAASGAVTLEVTDESGKLVRRFSSSDKPQPVDPNELNIPTYWIRPQRALSAEPGMHRFVWDLHYPPPNSLEHEYPISAIYHDTPRYPLGPSVLPGRYTVKLTVNGHSYTQALTIKMDPRVKTSQEGLRRQFELGSNIADAMARDYKALQQVKGLRQQLKGLRDHAGNSALTEAITALDNKAAVLQGVVGGYGTRFLSTPEGRSLSRLNEGLNTLLGTVDSADVEPTTHQVATFNDVNKAVEQQLAQWQEIRTQDVPALNLKLRDAGLQPLNPESAAVIQKEWRSVEKAAGED
jgi:hypothetical protein